MRHVIEVYVNGEKTNRFLKSINPGGYATTSDLRYAKKYKNTELDMAQGDCDLIAYFTNAKSIGVILPFAK